MAKEKNKYQDSMHLPKTGFPMRAGLAKAEPKRLADWNENHLYEQVRKKNEGHERFVLHDGPPYANGPIHIGHAMNKIAKDMINRYQMMQGKEVAYVPGWDCHGQPIEHKVEEALGTAKFNATPTAKIREMCHEFAVENIELQKAGFRRLGVLGDWEHPYLTLYHEHDAADIEVFKAMFDKGMIYRGRKPVHWCKHCHTALAEAEIEYADEVSPSVFVRFELIDVPEALASTGMPVDVVIWTTTPWTLPANSGVALSPEADYVAVEAEGRLGIMAKALWEKVFHEVAKLEDAKLFVPAGATEPWCVRGEDLVGITYHQPIFEGVTGKVVTADYVTLEDGTGCVHTAPGHGVDDYYTGMRCDLPIIMPVDDDGRFYVGDTYGTGGPFSGLDTDEANPKIIAWLQERGTLLAEKKIRHSYPHCWRCKNPTIFRATDQWFVSMDETGLREQALDQVRNHVRWYPERAANRIGAMVEGRPDWCISRQRNWGVPIPSYTCADCGEKVMNDATLDAVIALFKEKGSDAWFTDSPEEYLGDACVCPSCGGHHLKADRDILDVWWDSGVSWKAVCEKRPELSYPADVYLEGSDQHRGWFQSSLLTSVGANGIAPYKAVVSQGFTLDGQGRKMSKSLGNVIDPNKVCDEMGADIIRLWVASVDTSSDVAIDHEILARTSDAYRRFRNTFRFLLGELEDQFVTERDRVPFSKLTPLDKLMVARLTQVQAEVDDAYAAYEFNRAYRALYDFVVTELSNVYLDALKDRLYCEKEGSPARRSAQTVLAELLSMLLRDLQPILAFTTDEVMAYTPEGIRDGQTYAALLDWYRAPISLDEANALAPVLDAALELRATVTKALEEAREAGTFTKSQEVRVCATVPAELYGSLTGPDAPDLAEFYIVSEVELVEGDELAVAVEPAHGERCDRCWNYRESTGEHGEYEHICSRCFEALS
ncbi:isoleucine--tRNA ligase [Collinsella intestinalis]|uniref:isoleucine--tRNA ligase n=1 Tax=Collinsella intestinalis TaxID=147207 RepID=UPI00195EC146|nr:isoleucine--tRNA ligase [Collinsella intestinalis]MBM6683003.1 isoleucine--tRNA ligase [Collinsella intestinalis]